MPGHEVGVVGDVVHPSLEADGGRVPPDFPGGLGDDLQRVAEAAARAGPWGTSRRPHARRGAGPKGRSPRARSVWGVGPGAGPSRQPGCGGNALERHALLRPELAQHLDLLVQDRPPLVEGLPEGLVLDPVPPDAEAEAELPAGEQVELGRLLGQESGLALRPDEYGGGEVEIGEPGQVGEEQQGLVEGGVNVVGATEVAQNGGVAAEYVVVGRQVGVAE